MPSVNVAHQLSATFHWDAALKKNKKKKTSVVGAWRSPMRPGFLN